MEHCYRNRKGYFSKNVQLVCDYDLRILACYARFGGGAHDAFIWENSRVQQYLEYQYRQGIDTCWLIGDSGYPLQPWLMTPFRNPENASQDSFNQHHISARNCVERLNGVLKKVFACLSHDRGLLLDPAFAGAVVNACCTLHNFRKKNNLPMPEVVIEPPTNVELDCYEDMPNSTSILNEGRRVRERILRNYF